MKISLMIAEDGAQVSLTPETQHEKAILDLLLAGKPSLEIKKGPVWARTQGGFYRQFDERPNTESTVIVVTPNNTTEEK